MRISAFRSAATYILLGALAKLAVGIAQFCYCYPEVAVSIAEYDDRPDVEDELRKGRADLGITYLPTSKEFETWNVPQDEFSNWQAINIFVAANYYHCCAFF